MNCARCRKPSTVCCNGCATSNGQLRLCFNCYAEYHVGQPGTTHRPTVVSNKELHARQQMDRQKCEAYLAAAQRCSGELEILLGKKSGDQDCRIKQDFLTVKQRITDETDALLTAVAKQVAQVRNNAIKAAGQRYKQKKEYLTEIKQSVEGSLSEWTKLRCKIEAMDRAKDDNERLEQLLEIHQQKKLVTECIPPSLPDEAAGYHVVPSALTCLSALERHLAQLEIDTTTEAVGRPVFDKLADGLPAFEAGRQRPVLCRLLSDLTAYGTFIACQDWPARAELLSHIEFDLALRRAMQPDFFTLAEERRDRQMNAGARVYARCRDKVWRRGRVVAEASSNFVVQLVDIGVQENVPRDRLIDADGDTRYESVPELSFECALAEPLDRAALEDRDWLARRIGGSDRPLMLRASSERTFRSRRLYNVDAWPVEEAKIEANSEMLAASLAAEFSDFLLRSASIAAERVSVNRDIRLDANPSLPRDVYKLCPQAPSFEAELAPLIQQGSVRPLTDSAGADHSLTHRLSTLRSAAVSVQDGPSAASSDSEDDVVVIVDRSAVRAASQPSSQVTSPTSNPAAQQQPMLLSQLPLQPHSQHQPQLLPQPNLLPQHHLPPQPQPHQPVHLHPMHQPPPRMLLPPQVNQSLSLGPAPPPYGHHAIGPHHPHHPHHHAIPHAPAPGTDFDYAAVAAATAAPPRNLYASQPSHHPHHPMHPPPMHLSLPLFSQQFISPAGPQQQHPSHPPPHLLYGQPPRPAFHHHPSMSAPMPPPLSDAPSHADPRLVPMSISAPPAESPYHHAYIGHCDDLLINGSRHDAINAEASQHHEAVNGGEEYYYNDDAENCNQPPEVDDAALSEVALEDPEATNHDEPESRPEHLGNENDDKDNYDDDDEAEYEEAEDNDVEEHDEEDDDEEDEFTEAVETSLPMTAAPTEPRAELQPPKSQTLPQSGDLVEAEDSTTSPSQSTAAVAAARSGATRFNKSWHLGTIRSTLQKLSPEVATSTAAATSPVAATAAPSRNEATDSPTFAEGRTMKGGAGGGGGGGGGPRRDERRGSGGGDRASNKRQGGGNRRQPPGSGGAGGAGGGAPWPYRHAAQIASPRQGFGSGGNDAAGKVPGGNYEGAERDHKGANVSTRWPSNSSQQQQQSPATPMLRLCRDCGQTLSLCHCHATTPPTRIRGGGGNGNGGGGGNAGSGRGGARMANSGGGKKGHKGPKGGGGSSRKPGRRPSDSDLKRSAAAFGSSNAAIPAAREAPNVVTGEWDA